MWSCTLRTRGADGEHVGYLFSEEGKIFVRNLSFHADMPEPKLQRAFEDDPRGHNITPDRYRRVLRGKFTQ